MGKEYVKEHYSKSEVLKLGFSEKLISELLPEPILKPNPTFKSAAPMKLWLIKDVEEAMSCTRFLEYQEKAKNRRAGAKKAVLTKEAKLHKEVTNKIEQISVKQISLGELKNNTLSEKSSWYEYQSMLRGDYDLGDPYSADDSTIRRWEVNYIRHNLTEYDDSLYEMSGKVGCHKEYLRYKKAVLLKIGEAYPLLKSECNNQINKLKSADR